ncbi:MAG: hypothetical protein JXR86_19720 [Spirochaetales bacterium]|nr:hypothetical protein [Spirochaetales bacterium]
MRRFVKIIRNSLYFFLIYIVLSFTAISLFPYFLEGGEPFPFISRIFFSLFTSLLLLIPSIFYVTRKTTGDYIDAVKIEELIINENDVKDAVTNWVFVKYGKAVMGDVEINTSTPDGKINCRVNVVQD